MKKLRLLISSVIYVLGTMLYAAGIMWIYEGHTIDPEARGAAIFFGLLFLAVFTAGLDIHEQGNQGLRSDLIDALLEDDTYE